MNYTQELYLQVLILIGLTPQNEIHYHRVMNRRTEEIISWKRCEIDEVITSLLKVLFTSFN